MATNAGSISESAFKVCSYEVMASCTSFTVSLTAILEKRSSPPPCLELPLLQPHCEREFEFDSEVGSLRMMLSC